MATSVAPSSSTSARSGTTIVRERDAVDRPGRGADAGDRRPQLLRTRAALRHEHGGELRALDAGEACKCVVDLRRLRARHLEAAAGEVLRLARGERQGGEHDQRPHDQDGAPAAAQQAVEAEHGGLHEAGSTPRVLAGWPAKVHDPIEFVRDCGHGHRLFTKSP